MAKFRNVSGETLTIGYGFTTRRVIEPDEILVVPDTVAVNYAGQSGVWHPEDQPALDAEAERAGLPVTPVSIPEPVAVAAAPVFPGAPK